MRFLIFLIAFMFLTRPSIADVLNANGGVSEFDPTTAGIPAAEAMSSVLIEALPNFSFEPGKHRLSVAGGSFSHKTLKNQSGDPDNPDSFPITLDQDVSGYGFALAYTYAFSERWALTSIVSYLDGSGTITQNIADLASQSFSEKRKDRGIFAALGAVYQFFPRKTGFRLPLVLGLSYIDVEGGYTMNVVFDRGIRNGNSGTINESVDYAIPALYFGIAPQFAWENFTLGAFLFGAGVISERTITHTQTDNVIGDSATTEDKTERGGVQGAGIGIRYNPWNINLSYTNNLESTTKVSTLTLSWDFNFGDETSNKNAE